MLVPNECQSSANGSANDVPMTCQRVSRRATRGQAAMFPCVYRGHMLATHASHLQISVQAVCANGALMRVADALCGLCVEYVCGCLDISLPADGVEDFGSERLDLIPPQVRRCGAEEAAHHPHKLSLVQSHLECDAIRLLTAPRELPVGEVLIVDALRWQVSTKYRRELKQARRVSIFRKAVAQQ